MTSASRNVLLIVVAIGIATVYALVSGYSFWLNATAVIGARMAVAFSAAFAFFLLSWPFSRKLTLGGRVGMALVSANVFLVAHMILTMVASDAG